MRSLKGTLPWKVAYVANVVGRNASTLFLAEGQIRSAWRFTSVDGRGNPIPWFTFPAIKFLNALDLSQTRVLEYGSGASTEYWAHRVRSVASVENDRDWAARVAEKGLPNAEAIVEERPADYAAAGRHFGGEFDVVLIDGIERRACAEAALTLVAGHGMIILDNADVHPDARAVLASDRRFLGIDFEGFAPINGYTHVTSVFISRTTEFV